MLSRILSLSKPALSLPKGIRRGQYRSTYRSVRWIYCPPPGRAMTKVRVTQLHPPLRPSHPGRGTWSLLLSGGSQNPHPSMRGLSLFGTKTACWVGRSPYRSVRVDAAEAGCHWAASWACQSLPWACRRG